MGAGCRATKRLFLKPESRKNPGGKIRGVWPEGIFSNRQLLDGLAEEWPSISQRFPQVFVVFVDQSQPMGDVDCTDITVRINLAFLNKPLPFLVLVPDN